MRGIVTRNGDVGVVLRAHGAREHDRGQAAGHAAQPQRHLVREAAHERGVEAAHECGPVDGRFFGDPIHAAVHVGDEAVQARGHGVDDATQCRPVGLWVRKGNVDFEIGVEVEFD